MSAVDVVGTTWLNCAGGFITVPRAEVAFPIAVALFGLLGNAVAVWTLHVKGRVCGEQTVFGILLRSLVWTDLAGIVLAVPPVVAFYFGDRHWPTRAALCQWHGFVMLLFSLVMPLNVLAMAGERYLGICRAYLHVAYVTPQRARALLTVFWVASFAFALLPVVGIGKFAAQYPCTWCFIDMYSNLRGAIVHALAFSVFQLVVIISVTAFNIAVLVSLLDRHLKGIWIPASLRYSSSPKQDSLDLQMIVLLTIMSVIYVTGWLPLTLRIIMSQLGEEMGKGDPEVHFPHFADWICVRLAACNHCLDPWIYILCHKVWCRAPVSKESGVALTRTTPEF